MLTLEAPLLMETLVHMSPRVLRDSGHYSEVIQPTSSILAGISGANDFARCLLYDILDTVHRNYFPAGKVCKILFAKGSRTNRSPLEFKD